MPLPSPGDLHNPGIEPGSPAFQADALTCEPPGKSVLTVTVVLCFPECHTVGIIQYGAFSNWLLSLNNMNVSFLCVFLWLGSSFLFNAE